MSASHGDVLSRPSAAWAVVAAATVFLGVGLSLRNAIGIWPATGIASTLMLALTAAVEPQALRASLAVDRRSLLIGVLGAAVMIALTYALYPLVAGTLPYVGGEVAELYRVLRGAPGPLFALPILLLVVVAEEVVYRGLLFELLDAQLGRGVAILAAAALYVLPQVGLGSWLLAAVALGCGLAWTAQRAWAGGAAAPLITHLIWDLAVFVFFPLDG